MLLMVMLFGCLFLGLPIFIAMLMPSVYYLVGEMSMPAFLSVQIFLQALSRNSMLCIPFFMLAASVMGKGQIGPRLLKFARSIVGHMHGGMALTTILTCCIIGAISGQANAGILIIGAMMLKEMTENGYDKFFSAGLICTVSAVGMLIPPGNAFVIYATNTNTSVIRLFLAGAGAGVLYGIVFMVYSYIYARRKKIPLSPRATLGEFCTSLIEARWALGLPLIIGGTMYTGICSPTEASGLAAAYAILVEMFVYREIKFKGLVDIIVNCSKHVASVYVLLAAGTVLGYTMTVARIPQLMEALLGSSSRIEMLLIINLMFLIAGCFMGPGSAIVIIIPMVFQVAMKTGIDPIHLGAIVITNITIGMATPPFGASLFHSCRVMRMTFSEMVWSTLPFILLMLVILAIVTFVPAVSLFLPNLVLGPAAGVM